MFVAVSFLTVYNGTMDVGDHDVSVGDRVMGIGDHSMGVRDHIMSVGNGQVCINRQFRLGVQGYNGSRAEVVGRTLKT